MMKTIILKNTKPYELYYVNVVSFILLICIIIRDERLS